jgi:starch synthase (maltosyl-transferring)
MSVPKTRRPILIEHVLPAVDGGRFPVKREVGDRLAVSADIVKEGHDRLAAVIRYRAAGDAEWRETPLEPRGNDAWGGAFPLAANTRYSYAIEAWTDVFGTWVEEMRRRVAAGQSDLASEIAEGAEQIRRARERAHGADATALESALDRLAAADDDGARLGVLLDAGLEAVMGRAQDRRDRTRLDRELTVIVDRPQARFASWYELFPRSQGRVPGRHGTFRDVIDRLPDIAEMGFDVLYLPPIHPIGRTARKGPDNTLTAGPGDPGSPWAIGGLDGGHTSIHPDLGTIDDLRALVDAAAGHRIEIALDLAIQCSPDHPWVREHPEWFYRRPDGSIKYAENPPKKYQDIYPINFSCAAWESLWDALLGVVLHWIDHGVRTFRVDNPHTKPLDFWEWLIASVQARHPEVVFLSEAFTRPKVMRGLAKIGFSQSYTYFTWRNFKEEITAYFEELTRSEMVEYFRGNLFANTPDILPEILQRGGPPAFRMRAALAATLGSLWGIYSGFELCEGEAMPGTEEYRGSEKYEIRVRDWDAPGNLRAFIGRLNAIRRENPALQQMRTLRFHHADSPHVLFYGKTTPEGDNIILAAVNLDPFAAHEARLTIPMDELGIPADETYELHELLTDRRRLVRGPRHPVALDPAVAPAHIYRVERWKKREQDFQYFY